MSIGNVITEKYALSKNDSLRDRLEKLRKNKGYYIDSQKNTQKLTQENLSYYLNVSVRQYTNYLNEKTNMDSEILCKLSDLYGVSIDCLLCRTHFTSVNNEMISQETGLTDSSIENIKKLNDYVRGMNESLELFNELSGGTLKREPQLVLNTFNRLLSSVHFIPLIFSFYDFLRTHYNKPVHFVPGIGWQFNNRKINNDVPCVTLAYDETNPTENIDIEIDETFLETIALNKLKKVLYEIKSESLNRKSMRGNPPQ